MKLILLLHYFPKISWNFTKFLCEIIQESINFTKNVPKKPGSLNISVLSPGVGIIGCCIIPICPIHSGIIGDFGTKDPGDCFLTFLNKSPILVETSSWSSSEICKQTKCKQKNVNKKCKQTADYLPRVEQLVSSVVGTDSTFTFKKNWK